MNLNITVFIQNFNIGGAENTSIKVANELFANNYNVRIICLKKSGRLINRVNKKISIIELKKRTIFNSFFEFHKYFKKKDKNIIFSSIINLNIFLCLYKIFFLKNIKIIIRESNSNKSFYFSNHKSIKKSTLFFSRFFLYSFANLIIAPSEGVKKELLNLLLINKKNVIKLYNPMDVKNIIDESNNILNSNFFKSKKIRFISIGRLTKQKNHEMLIESMSLIKNANYEFICLIVGKGELKYKLTKLIDEKNLNKNIFIVDHLDDLYSNVKKADIFISTSLWEGMPNNLIEAYIIGTKILATNCEYGPYEILGNSKELIKSYNEIDLYNRIVVEIENRNQIIDNKRNLKRFEKKNFFDVLFREINKL